MRGCALVRFLSLRTGGLLFLAWTSVHRPERVNLRFPHVLPVRNMNSGSWRFFYRGVNFDLSQRRRGLLSQALNTVLAIAKPEEVLFSSMLVQSIVKSLLFFESHLFRTPFSSSIRAGSCSLCFQK
jgi:hypothetical protein